MGNTEIKSKIIKYFKMKTVNSSVIKHSPSVHKMEF